VNEPALALPVTPVTRLHVGDSSGNGYHQPYLSSEAPDVPDGTRIVRETHDIGGGFLVECILYGDHLFVGPKGEEFGWGFYGADEQNTGLP
jgi:hypothetical protein